jgi:predicted GNAT family acetyltransferase
LLGTQLLKFILAAITIIGITLSQQLLDAGWEFCALFTDLANPTSNSIYQKVGYQPVADFDEYIFGG